MTLPNKGKPDYLALINGDCAMPDGFREKFELVSAPDHRGNLIQVEKKTYDAFLRLQEDLSKNDGISAVLLEAYRSVELQREIFDYYTESYGIEYATKYAARPGHSEHHTGLAIDVGILYEDKLYCTIADMLKVDHLFAVVHKKLPLYGFILRYPADKTEITKIGYEPWHFRYIDSPDAAGEMADEGLCLEEYHALRLS